MLEKTFHYYIFRTNTLTFHYTNFLFQRTENKSTLGNEKCSKHTKRTYFTLHRNSACDKSVSQSSNKLAHNPLQPQHNPHWTCICLLWHYRKPASQPTSSDVMFYSLPCAVLFCVLLFPIPPHLSLQSNFSSPDTRASHGPMGSVAEVGWCLCDTYQMAMSTCLCNDDASNLRSICGVFSLSVLNYSAKFRIVRTRALLRNPFLLLVQISVEVLVFVHTCLSGIHVLLAVFFVYYCALLFDWSTPMYFKRVHMSMSCYSRNHILKPSFPVIRGTVGPVHLEILTLC